MGGGDVILNPPHDGSMRCSLRVRPDPGGIACIVFGDDEPGNDDDARRWHQASAAAVEKMGKHDQDFAWRAILGPHPSAPEWRRPSPLAEPVMLGPVTLTSGGVRMRELTGYAHGRIDTPWPARYTWPLIISGTVRTYNSEYAEYQARKLVHRACALLDVLGCGHARLAPHPESAGRHDLTNAARPHLSDNG